MNANTNTNTNNTGKQKEDKAMYTIANLVTDLQNGYIRDRRHERRAAWEVKEAILQQFNSDNHTPITLAIGNWMVCAGYAVMNRTDVEFYAITDRVMALCANGTHITKMNKQNNAAVGVFSTARVLASLYRAIEGDCKVYARKDENCPTVKEAKKATSKKEARIVRIMEKFGCDRKTAEEMAV